MSSRNAFRGLSGSRTRGTARHADASLPRSGGRPSAAPSPRALPDHKGSSFLQRTRAGAFNPLSGAAEERMRGETPRTFSGRRLFHSTPGRLYATQSTFHSRGIPGASSLPRLRRPRLLHRSPAATRTPANCRAFPARARFRKIPFWDERVDRNGKGATNTGPRTPAGVRVETLWRNFGRQVVSPCRDVCGLLPSSTVARRHIKSA